jgi:glycerol dehydrogenase-like iron-containing ADH family enzyme
METIWNLPRIEIKDLGTIQETRPAAVLTGDRAWGAVGSMLNLPIVVQAEPHTADIKFLESLSGGLPEQVVVVYGIGGGLAAVVAKYVAWKHNLPCVIVPTALSVDGFFTALVAVRKEGSVYYETTGPAESIIIDWDIVSNAPAHIRGTGIVEILSMTTGLLDWRYAADHNPARSQTSRAPHFPVKNPGVGEPTGAAASSQLAGLTAQEDRMTAQQLLRA